MTDFEPIGLIKDCHALPHLNTHLQTESNTFGIYYTDFWNTYTRSLLPLPIIIGALGVLSVFFLVVALCFRACCSWCRCTRSEAALLDNSRPERTACSITTLTILFYFFAFLTILSDQSLFFGNKYLTRGVDDIDNALSFLHGTFQTLSDDGNTLVDSGATLSADADSASLTCVAITPTVTGYIDDFNSDAADYSATVNPLPGYISNAQDEMNLWGDDYKNRSIWALYAVVILIVISYQLGLWCKSKIYLQFNIFLSELLILVFIIMCVVEMIIVMGLSDFCMSPTSNTLQVMDPTTSTFDSISFYLTCNGTNPVTEPLTAAYSAIDSLAAQLDSLELACPGNPYITDMANEVLSIQGTLDSITNATACEPIQAQADNVLQSGLCYNSFIGVFIIWVSQYVTAATLFLLTVVVSITYQNFGQFWDIGQQQKQDAVVLETPTYLYFESDHAQTGTVNHTPYQKPRV